MNGGFQYHKVVLGMTALGRIHAMRDVGEFVLSLAVANDRLQCNIVDNC
jgi:hypothetical protein